MDILKPEYMWVENRCYRLLPIKDKIKNIEDECEPCYSSRINEDDDYDTELPIKHHGDRFYISIYVPGPLTQHVCGKYGRMREALEKYGASVKIPPKTNADAPITITGDSKKVVADTYYRIENIVITSRFREDFTHFVSVPMNSEEIKNSFLEFKENVLRDCKRDKGIDESIFQDPAKLHLTVAPLVLLDERDKQKAEAVLAKCIENIMKDCGDKQLVVIVKGIEYMNDDPSEVSVLYAKLQEADDDNVLQLLADNIMKAFMHEKLSKDKYENVKLHVTLMNTLFREKKNDGSVEKTTFNTQPILQKFCDFNFGQITVSEVHLSVRYTTASDGYYRACCKMELN